jgi:ABC-type transport system involved in multi-copper enzyme maturation permease subunit
MPKFRTGDWLPWRWRLFGPILPFDLITSSRRVRWYVLRFLLAGLMLFVLWQSHQQMEFWSQYAGSSREAAKARFAQSFYASFASVHLTAALLLATAFLGGVVADDRRRRVLDFLFATDLTNREIILGKFVSRTFMIGALLSGSLPILAATMLFGGVSADWIAQLAVITVSTLICFGGISVLVSTTVARPRDAVVRAIMLTLLLVVLSPVASFFTFFGYRLPEWFEYVAALNPYRVIYFQIYGSVPTLGMSYAWDQTLNAFFIQTAVGVVALLWAILTVRRTIVRPPSETGSKKSLLRPRRFLRPKLGNMPPIFWKEAFGEPAVKTRGWLGRAVATFIFVAMNVGIIGTWVYAVSNSFDRREEASMMSMGVLASMVAIFALILVGTRAASTVTTEREGDTWTTLLAGPIPAGHIVAGKIFGSAAAFWHLLIPFGLCWVLAALFEPAEALLRGAVMLAVCVLLCVVNANIGFYFSLRSKSSSAASVKTIITVLVLGGGYIIPLAMMIRGPDEGIQTLSQFFLVCYPAFGEWGSPSGHEQKAWASFVIGVILYFGFAALSYTFNRSAFDGYVGRMETAVAPPPRLPPTSTGGRPQGKP